MKKRIFAILLSALLMASATACNYTPDNIPENETESTLEGTEDTPNSPEKDESSNETPNQNEIVRDVPGLGQLRYLSRPTYLTKASIWRSNEKEEYYIYINEWDAYRPMLGLSSYHCWWYLTDNCITIDNEAATIAIIDQDGKHHEPTLITYRFNKSDNLVELHAVPLNIKASSEYDTFFVNMLNEDHGYYFLTSNMDGDHYWRINEFPGGDVDKVWEWPLFMFETTDGGKSWNQMSTNTFSPGASDHINILKFVSPQVGIISFRYIDVEDLCDRTYLTLDGGLTWTQLSQLPYPFDLKKTHNWYSEIIDLEQKAERYYLTVKVCGILIAIEGSGDSYPSDRTTIEIRFESEDLINWNLIED